MSTQLGISPEAIPLSIEQQFLAGVLSERCDTVALLVQRKEQALSISRRASSVVEQDQARDRARLLEVLIGEFSGGLHAGAFNDAHRREARKREGK